MYASQREREREREVILAAYKTIEVTGEGARNLAKVALKVIRKESC